MLITMVGPKLKDTKSKVLLSNRLAWNSAAGARDRILTI